VKDGVARARRPRVTASARRKLCELDRLLDLAYRAPAADLDNKPDPLDEAIYIILSFQTDLERIKRVWAELRSAFPAWEDLATAPDNRVAEVLRSGGLQEQKARTIKRLLSTVKEHTGRWSLDFLRTVDDWEAEQFLRHLPGLSWKGARCVLLYSLDRAVFPVDGNTFRILRRVGILPRDSVYRRRSLHDTLQLAVAPARRRPFHINLVVHGQRICRPIRPRCHECPVRAVCRMRGVLAAGGAETTANGSPGRGKGADSETGWALT
jgi:endonuclease III